jgi:environmental stress-induced protein Ves
MSEPRRIDVDAIAPTRWKNGAGLTREIAVSPPGATMDSFDWRLSVAELQRDAPFSAFAGVDRCIAALDGAGMSLTDALGAAVQSLQPLEPWSFAGERALQAQLPHGPCRDFNVMTRRGRWRAELRVLRRGAVIGSADATLLLAVRGRWRCAAELLLPLQGLLWEAPHGTSTLEALDAEAALLHLRLCHDHQP